MMSAWMYASVFHVCARGTIRVVPSGFWRANARVLLVPVLGFIVISLIAAAILWVTIPTRPVPINVRWIDAVTDAEREALEQQLGLTLGSPTEGTTWAYTLIDPSTSKIRAIVQHPRVDDTAHVNRIRFRPALEYDKPRRVALLSLATGAVGALLLWAHSMLSRLRPTVTVAPSALLAIASTPPATAAAAAAVFLVLAAAGLDPIWDTKLDVTLPEAAAAKDYVMVAKLIDAGSDPNTAGVVSIDGRILTLTPLEGAVISRDLETVALLTRQGATMDGEMRTRLTCLAIDVGAEDVAGFLATEGQMPDCADVILPAH